MAAVGRYRIDRWRQDLKRDRYSSKSEQRRWFNQRGHWWLRKRETGESVFEAGWQVVLPGRGPGFRIAVTPTDDEPFNFHIGIGIVDAWLSVNSRPLRRLAERMTPQYKGYSFHDDREISLRFFSGAVWWMLWMDDNEWRSTDPKWRRGSWHPLDTFFGRYQFSKRVLSITAATIRMPEGEYAATVELSEDTWKRPRWPWAKRLRRAEVEVPNPPMFAGKGENSWDQDDDGIYSMTTPAATVEEAIEKYRASVLRNRAKYGMPEGLNAD